MTSVTVTDVTEQQFTVQAEPWEAPDGARLRAAQRAELDARYGGDDHEPGPPPPRTTSPSSSWPATRRTGRGVRRLASLAEGEAEVKRMYVDPGSRGSGVATAVLRALEDAARARGVRRMLLETGTAQPEALRFYLREGYERIEAFGPYVGSSLSICCARDL